MSFVFYKCWITLSVLRTSGCLHTHGLAQHCLVGGGDFRCESTEQGQGGRKGEGAVACRVCNAVLVCVTSRCAAVESGPEFSCGGGSRGLLSRGQQWGGGSSVTAPVKSFSSSPFLCSSSSSSAPASGSVSLLGLLFSSSPQVWAAKVTAGIGTMRAAAAPWWRPGPCAVWPPSLTSADSTDCSCRGAGDKSQREYQKQKTRAFPK